MPIFRDIPGYEGLYQVSDSGEVRAIFDCRGKKKAPRILKPSTNVQGYLHVGLTRDGRCRDYAIHVLVALAFIGPCPEGFEVDHKDDVKIHNHESNLQYLTKLQNMRKRAYSIPQKQIEEMCALSYHFSNRAIAKMYGVSSQVVDWHINNRKMTDAGIRL